MPRAENRELKQLLEIVITQGIRETKAKYGKDLSDPAMGAFLTQIVRDWFVLVLKSSKHQEADTLLKRVTG